MSLKIHIKHQDLADLRVAAEYEDLSRVHLYRQAEAREVADWLSKVHCSPSALVKLLDDVQRLSVRTLSSILEDEFVKLNQATAKPRLMAVRDHLPDEALQIQLVALVSEHLIYITTAGEQAVLLFFS